VPYLDTFDGEQLADNIFAQLGQLIHLPDFRCLDDPLPASVIVAP